MYTATEEFNHILTMHQEKYPDMLPVDYGKLAYQNEFGPKHMITDTDAVYEGLLTEWQDIGKIAERKAAEPIGNQLCRFHLTDGYELTSASRLLAKLFIKTSGEQAGTIKGLQEKLALLRERKVSGMKEWLDSYEKSGFAAVHHSSRFRSMYHPHYRVLRYDYAIYFPLLLKIQEILEKKEFAVISIDGRCGSGKTGLAEVIERIFPCRCLHMDDYYLPMEKRAPDWETAVAGNMDIERFLKEALLPAREGKPICYRPFSCREGRLMEAVTMEPCPLTVVDGSYSQHPRLAGYYDLKFFVSCSKEAQAERLRCREGDYYEAFVRRWIPMEERYYKAFDIESGSDAIIDTSEFF